MALFDTSAATPPADLSAPRQALWWLEKGGWRVGPEWEAAHQICQGNEGESGHDLVHGIAHLVEGDLPNADYWYRRAGSRRMSDDPRTEADRIAPDLD